jgi:hypothetical protein
MPSNLFIVLSVLAFLGTTAVVALGLGFAGWGWLKHNRLMVRRSLQGVAMVVVGYGLVLAVVSLASQERVLPPGAEKYFCELDCHLAYSVAGAVPIRSAEGGSTTWAVRLRTRFDERTISPQRGREAPLWPNPRKLTLVGSDGRWYPESADLAAALADSSTPITKELRPGESYTTLLTFVLPPGVKPAKLDVAEDVFVNRLIIGHEQSFLHRPVLLQLAAG